MTFGMTRAPCLRPKRGRASNAAAIAILATVVQPLVSSAAPRSAYNGDAFTSAPNTPSADSGDAVASQTGTYSYTFPIEVPPGRLGMQPTIGLTYRSDGAIYGGVAAGWSLDVPAILSTGGATDRIGGGQADRGYPQGGRTCDPVLGLDTMAA